MPPRTISRPMLLTVNVTQISQQGGIPPVAVAPAPPKGSTFDLANRYEQRRRVPTWVNSKPSIAISPILIRSAELVSPVLDDRTRSANGGSSGSRTRLQRRRFLP